MQDTNGIAVLAELVGDIMTACPAVCDARPALLADLAACEAAAPAAARCMKACLAHMSPEALTAALACCQPDGTAAQVPAISSPAIPAHGNWFMSYMSVATCCSVYEHMHET